MTQPVPPRLQTILVVDDIPDNILLLVELLRGLFRVKVAPNGAKALEIAGSEEPPDLILLDVLMPGMDGYEVCRRLKADPSTRGIPVLFLTAKSEIEDEARGFASGAADYILKPFSPALVMARIRTHLEQRRLLSVERELLEKTLRGSLTVILEMITTENPNASEWNERLADLAESVARTMGMEEPWMVGLAGALSRIGTLTVPKSVLEKVKLKIMLNSEERQAYNRIPEVGSRLLKNIPRLEDVAEMIYYSQKNFNGTGFPSDERCGDDIPLGGRILRVCLDFTNTTPTKEDPTQAVSDMLLNGTLYDSEVIFALKKVLEAGFFPQTVSAVGAGIQDRAIKDLQVGDVLDDSIETAEGKILLRQGTVLTASHLERLENFALIGAIHGPVSIRAKV